MSTNVTPSDSFPLAVEKDETFPQSFRALRRRLEALRAVPSLDELNRLLGEVEVGMDDLRPYVGFKAGTYARHRVFRNDFAELLVLCWRPGQRTPIHDHNGSHGA